MTLAILFKKGLIMEESSRCFKNMMDYIKFVVTIENNFTLY